MELHRGSKDFKLPQCTTTAVHMIYSVIKLLQQSLNDFNLSKNGQKCFATAALT